MPTTAPPEKHNRFRIGEIRLWRKDATSGVAAAARRGSTRHMPTAPQQRLIDAIFSVAHADPRISSAWLTGSVATGEDDEWSDVDVLLVGPDGDLDGLVQDWLTWLDRIAPTIHVITFFGRVISAVTSDWERFDVAFAAADQIRARDPGGLRMLFARMGATMPEGAPANAQTAGPTSVEPLVREFLRVLGLSPVVIHREDPVLLLEGLAMLRSLLVDLMLVENGRSRSDRGLKRVGQALTSEQRAELASLPAFDANPEHVRPALQALASMFLSRAKPVSARLHSPWPEAFETATRAHLRGSLGLDL